MLRFQSTGDPAAARDRLALAGLPPYGPGSTSACLLPLPRMRRPPRPPTFPLRRLLQACPPRALLLRLHLLEAALTSAVVIAVAFLWLFRAPESYRVGHPRLESYALLPRRHDALLLELFGAGRGIQGGGTTAAPPPLSPGGGASREQGEYPLCAATFFRDGNCCTLARTAGKPPPLLPEG